MLGCALHRVKAASSFRFVEIGMSHLRQLSSSRVPVKGWAFDGERCARLKFTQASDFILLRPTKADSCVSPFPKPDTLWDAVGSGSDSLCAQQFPHFARELSFGHNLLPYGMLAQSVKHRYPLETMQILRGERTELGVLAFAS